MCGSMVDIQSAAAEIRRWKKERKKTRLGRKVNFAAGKISLGTRASKNVDIVYQRRRRPNIVQSLVDLRCDVGAVTKPTLEDR